MPSKLRTSQFAAAGLNVCDTRTVPALSAKVVPVTPAPFVSFSTLVVLLLWPVYLYTGIKPGGVNTILSVFKWLLDMVYMYFAVRSVYGLGTVKTIPASVVLVVGYFICYALVLLSALVAAIVSVGLS